MELSLSLLVAALTLALPTLWLLLRPTATNGPEQGLPVMSSASFWTVAHGFFYERYDWVMATAARESKTGLFRFRLVGLEVVAIGGGSKAGIEAFFTNPRFSLSEGYAILFGAGPSVTEAVKVKDEQDPHSDVKFAPYFNRRLIELVKEERLDAALPQLISAIKYRLGELGTKGSTNPFDSIYEIVFHLTMLTVGTKDIADDPALLKKVLGLYEAVEASSTPMTILFPWIPGPAKFRRVVAATRLYFILQGIVSKREKTGIKESDPLQHLIDSGDSMRQIIEFIIGALFAGLLNSGINAAYVLTYLSQSPPDAARALEEIQTLAARYSPASSPLSPPLTLVEQLDHIPTEAWLTEFPFLDNCLRDSIRLNAAGSGFRKNLGGPQKIGGEVIKEGGIVIFPFASVHMDEEIYRKPYKWDPSRYEEGREEDKKGGAFAYLGWGVGRHPCLGMKFAKLEANLITAYFLASYTYTTTNSLGEPITAEDLKADLNQLSAAKPKKEVCFHYQKRVD